MTSPHTQENSDAMEATPSTHLLALFDKIEARSARVGIIGQGYVGLPLAMVIAETGFDVTGFEVDSDKVRRLNAGESYIDDISDGEVKEQLVAQRFRASESFEDVGNMDVISICVPTPLGKTRDPDISYIVAAAKEVVSRHQFHHFVVDKWMVYPMYPYPLGI